MKLTREQFEVLETFIEAKIMAMRPSDLSQREINAMHENKAKRVALEVLVEGKDKE